MRLHRILYFVLCRLEFFLKRIPLIGFRKIIDAVASTENVLTNAERLGQLEHIRTNVFYLLAVLRFNRDKTIRN